MGLIEDELEEMGDGVRSQIEWNRNRDPVLLIFQLGFFMGNPRVSHVFEEITA
jgi:hypothetical protein